MQVYKLPFNCSRKEIVDAAMIGFGHRRKCESCLYHDAVPEYKCESCMWHYQDNFKKNPKVVS